MLLVCLNKIQLVPEERPLTNLSVTVELQRCSYCVRSCGQVASFQTLSAPLNLKIHFCDRITVGYLLTK